MVAGDFSEITRIHISMPTIKLTFLLLPLLLLSAYTSFANDSTLYQKRIQQIRSLYNWLSVRNYEPINIYTADTVHPNWKSYDTVLNLFFDKREMDSSFNSRDLSDNISFTAEAKFQMLKQELSKFHELTQKQCFDDLLFKMIEPENRHTPQSEEDSIYLQNEIEQYFMVKQRKISWVSFHFKNAGMLFSDMPVLGMPMNEYLLFREFYDRLIPCHTNPIPAAGTMQ